MHAISPAATHPPLKRAALAWPAATSPEPRPALTRESIAPLVSSAAKALEATVTMTQGLRNFRVRYFQGPREGIALMLAWKRPGTTDYQHLPLRLLGRPQTATLASAQPRD